MRRRQPNTLHSFIMREVAVTSRMKPKRWCACGNEITTRAKRCLTCRTPPPTLPCEEE